MRFVDNHIKIKSNWFDKNGVFSKIGSDAFNLYITLYRFHVQNQNECTFVTSIKALKKETGLTIHKTYELFKALVRYKVIKSNVARWDRYKDNDLMTVAAMDLPKTIRTENENGKEIDSPVSADDNYISVDLNMMQYYLDNGLHGGEMGLYCLMRKWNHSMQGKMWMSIDKMAEHLGMSNDKVHKMIHKLNRMYLLCSIYRKNGKRVINGRKVTVCRFEHHICERYTSIDRFKQLNKNEIDKNIKKWDKGKGNKTKSKGTPFLSAYETEDIFEDQEHESNYMDQSNITIEEG
jgi:hypothetical protein